MPADENEKKRRGASSSIVVRSISAVYVLALGLWAGGLVVLGAIVAPTVFGIVPAPSSADAMTVVFRKFDAVAIACGLVALLAEAAFAWLGGRTTRLDLARGSAATVAAGLAIVGGAWLSPAIQALHEGGAIRGFGEAGAALETFHRRAESVAKAELVLVISVILLLVMRVARPAHPSPPPDDPLGGM